MKESLQNSNIVINSTGSRSNSNILVIDQHQQQQQPQQVTMTVTGWYQSGGGGAGGGGGAAAAAAAAVGIGMVKVMTDEQMEMLRKQIRVYATLSERLVELHKLLSSQHPLPFSGTRLSNPYCDPLLSSANNKIPARQRWTPTAMQLQILERMFKQCNSTPGRQKIKEIRPELAQYGQISEANVYNWFQNRRARSKRKLPSPVSKTGESGPQAKITSEEEKNMELEDDMHQDENLALIISNMNFQGPEIGIDQLIGETKVPGSHWQLEQYGSSG